MGPHSPVLAVYREQGVPYSAEGYRQRCARASPQTGVPWALDGIQAGFARAWKMSRAIPKEGPAEFKLCHGLRKFWEVEAKRSVGMRIGTWRGVDDRIVREDVEILMGHRCSYHRPALERLEAVYLAMQPLLSFKPSGRPREDNGQTENAVQLARELRLGFARQQAEIALLDRKVDRLMAMVEQLIPTPLEYKRPRLTK